MGVVVEGEGGLAPAIVPEDHSAESGAPAATRSRLAGRRIVIVLGSLDLGGAERQAILLARALREVGAEVQVWGKAGSTNRVAELCDDRGIPWRAVEVPDVGVLPGVRGLRKDLRSLLRFSRKLRASRPDIVLPYTTAPNIACGIVWRLSGAAVCLWNQRTDGSERRARWAERLGTALVPSFVANSVHGADFMVDAFGARRDRITIVHNGVESGAAEIGRDEAREELSLPRHAFVACMVANLHPLKDHETLIHAWRSVVSRLGSEGIRPVLLLAGRHDRTFERVRSLVEELRLHESVRFMGPVRNVPLLLRASDLGILSTRFEGLPNAVLEYMVEGLPVTGNDHPGICEAVGPDGLDYLVPGGDPDALAEMIVRLAMNPALRTSIGEANRRRAATEFSPSVMVDRMCAEIVGLLPRRASNATDAHGVAARPDGGAEEARTADGARSGGVR